MEKRQAHIIKPNHKKEIPQNLIFFDTETTERILERDKDIEGETYDEKELILKLGVLCYWRRIKDREQVDWYDYTTPEKFWSFIMSKLYSKQKLYLIAHNVAFDFRVLKGFHFMREYGFKTTKLVYNNTTNIWEFRNGNKTICVIDNMNFFKSSLKSLGKSVGLTKKDMPTNDDKKLLEYCTRDVEIMVHAWELLFKFIDTNNLGNFNKTIASQAFSAYRHRFMPEKIYVHTNNLAIEFERDSYHGGRTEAFFIGKAPRQFYYLLDVVSMYPSVMVENKYPVKLNKIEKNITIRKLERLLRTKCIIADVDIYTSEAVYPVKRDGKLIFPVGYFRTKLTTRELIYALNNNSIRKVHTAIIYDAKILFSEYCKFFYDKKVYYKEIGDDAFTYLCKLFLNSLYGKFGQRTEKCIEMDCPKSWGDVEDGIFQYYDEKDRHVTERRINGRIYKTWGEKVESYNSFVGIASHITADVRIKLYKYFKLAGLKNIYYCDTDSMIVNQEGYDRCEKAIIPDLGFLSLKGKTSHLEIYGAKDYVFKDDVVIKGIRKDAKQITPVKYSQIKFEGLRGSIRKGRLNQMILTTVEKTLSRKYDKGKLCANGRVLPFYIKS